MLTLTLSVALT